MRFVRARNLLVTVVAAVVVVGSAGILAHADAMPTEAMSPAGNVTGSTVCLGLGFGTAPPAVVPSPVIVNPKGGLLSAPAASLQSPLIVNPNGPLFTPPLSTPVAGAPRPALAPITLLAPTPATGSLVVPMTVPPASATGPSFTRMQLVIPGPNPAQNTAVSLSQLLSSTLASLQSSAAATAPGAALGSPSHPVSCF